MAGYLLLSDPSVSLPLVSTGSWALGQTKSRQKTTNSLITHEYIKPPDLLSPLFTENKIQFVENKVPSIKNENYGFVLQERTIS